MADKSLEAHLYECLKEGNTKKALYIIELLGDNINKLYRGKSPLVWAKEFENEDVINALSEKGAIEEVIDEEKAKELGKEFIQKMFDGNFEVVDEYIAKGANFNVEYDATTPLIYAIEKNRLDVVEKLIKSGADVNKSSRHYMRPFNVYASPLAMAIRCYSDDVFEMLVDAGANVKDDKAALFEAFRCNRFDIVDELLEKGANVEFLFTQNVYNVDQANYLLKNGFKPDYQTIKDGMENGSYMRGPILAYLDSYDIANIDVVDDEGKTLLFRALEGRQDQIAAKLIDMGANVNFGDKNTALLIGAYQECFEVVKKLIEKGEDINQVNEYNQTPLYLAVMNATMIYARSAQMVVEYLLQHGADTQIACDDGTTPLECAVRHKKSKIVEIILNNTDGVPKDFSKALRFSGDRSKEREMLMDHVERIIQNNPQERERIMLEITKDRY